MFARHFPNTHFDYKDLDEETYRSGHTEQLVEFAQMVKPAGMRTVSGIRFPLYHSMIPRRRPSDFIEPSLTVYGDGSGLCGLYFESSNLSWLGGETLFQLDQIRLEIADKLKRIPTTQVNPAPFQTSGDLGSMRGTVFRGYDIRLIDGHNTMLEVVAVINDDEFKDRLDINLVDRDRRNKREPVKVARITHPERNVWEFKNILHERHDPWAPDQL